MHWHPHQLTALGFHDGIDRALTAIGYSHARARDLAKYLLRSALKQLGGLMVRQRTFKRVGSEQQVHDDSFVLK